jgi:hypothetical protein
MVADMSLIAHITRGASDRHCESPAVMGVGDDVQVAVCCFDKTGTLTSDNMVLKGLVGLAGRARELVADVQEGPRECLRVLATCQSLILVDGDLVGDPLERAAFQSTGEPLPLSPLSALTGFLSCTWHPISSASSARLHMDPAVCANSDFSCGTPS